MAAFLVMLLVAACSSPIAAGPSPPASAGSLTPGPSGSPRPADAPASGDLAMDPCRHVHATEERLTSLRAVELRVPERVALDIELGQVQAAFDELRQADFGELQEQLETPLTRLGYRLVDLELAIEDFRTNPRPRQAAAHVEEDSQAFADALAGFALLARC